MAFKKFLNEYKIQPFAYCDNREVLWGKNIESIPVISPSELFERYSDSAIVITTSKYGDEIYQQLKENNIAIESVIKVEPCLEQYFDVFSPRTGEVFVDAGCFDVSTSKAFSAWCNGDYKMIYAFEPNSKFIDMCRKNIHLYGLKNIQLINKGTWSKSDRLIFCDADQGSKIVESGTEVVDVVSIDEIMNTQKVDFIKMDVEGSEMEALIGAQETIKTHKPRLAICVYHKPEDIFFIPLFLSQLVPEYRFYLRRYSFDMRETVLYAEC